jgi:hypothetical protein
MEREDTRESEKGKERREKREEKKEKENGRTKSYDILLRIESMNKYKGKETL